VEKTALTPQFVVSGEMTKNSETHKIEGIVEKINFHNSENGFTVFKINRSDIRNGSIEATSNKNNIDLVTVVGNTSSIAIGEYVSVTGEWVKNKNYGEQFAAHSIQLTPPNTIEEIEKYLASGAINGIGEHDAAKLVKAFGIEIFEVLEKNPQKLLEVENLSQKQIDQIKESWIEKGIIQRITLFLQTHGMSPSKAIKIFNKYGNSAIDLLQSNPYQLVKDIPGIGFKSADQIALHLGIGRQSQLRARAGLNYILSEKNSSGHCAYPREKLLNDAEFILNIDQELIREELDQELKEGFLVAEEIDNNVCIFQKLIYQTEKSIATLIGELKKGSTPWPYPKNIDKSLSKTEKKLKLTLASLQKLAIHTALINKMSVITGGPGTGKSTLTLALTNYLSQLDIRITLCSPTGRAAKRLSECTGMEAKTIHRLLIYDREKREFKYNSLNPLETDFVLVDEASMLDIFLVQALLKAIPSHAVLVFVGDVDQLPPVGLGQFLKDLIQSEIVPVITLSQIFRQAKESQIIQAAHKINEGQMPDLSPHRMSDFFFLEKNTPLEVEETILDLISHRLPSAFGFNPVHDIQVLCPMQKGVVGVKNLNLKIQQLLNKNPIAQIEKYGFHYGVGDKVMVTENNYDKDVFNGDMGIVETISLEDQRIQILIDGRLIEFNFSELETIQPSYAITIHKSQGSEYSAVIIPVVTEHSIMMQRNLIYTAITRGKKLVVLVGQTRALYLAVNELKKRKRWTKLKEWLKEL